MRPGRIRRRRARPPRLRGISINRMLPNILTTLSLCAGLTAMRFAIQERWQPAVVAVIIAAVLDGLDGRLARLLRVSSRFGAELDSLSDFVSFGVAPAMVLYLWTLREAGGFGWIVVLAYCVCAALRLARFNTVLGQSDLPAFAYNYFTGVPTPAGAGLALLPLMIDFMVRADLSFTPVLVGVWAVIIGLLMVSPLPTFSMKGVRVPHRYAALVLLGVGLLAALLVTEPWATLILLGVLYLGTLPLSYREFRRLRHEAERLRTAGAEGEGASASGGAMALPQGSSGPTAIADASPQQPVAS